MPDSRHMALVPSVDLLSRFKDYESSHQTPGNRWTHWIGIPAVVFSLLGLLSQLQVLATPMPVDAAKILLGIAVLWTLRVDWKVAIPFGLTLTALYILARELSLSVLWSVQAIGWFFQLYGHAKYEKKRPKFLESVEHIFVGPLWKFATLTQYYVPPRARNRTK